MLSCPFCGAELGASSNRLRGGRCPSCGSILSWDDQATVQFDVPLAPQLPMQQPPVPPPAAMPTAAMPPVERTLMSDDEDAMPMRDIVRTLVNRGPSDAGNVRQSMPPPVAQRPAAPAPIERTIPEPMLPAADSYTPEPQGPSGTKSPTAAFAATLVTPPLLHSPAAPPAGSPPPEVEKIWRGSATVASRPSMTLKTAAPNEPDPSINDLLIRPFRIGQPGDPPNAGAEYELEEVIGEGGVGVVYAARQASIDRTVAIKTLREEFAHKRDHRNKFLSEAVVTGELDHPNIVPIYDLGTSDTGMLFYAMKRVRGTPWSDVIRHTSLAENLRVLMSVADAIAFAHSRGVVHRDLKPENIMLGDYGEVLVMDWGIALSTSMCVKSDRISQSTSMGGTPAYMAPELALGPIDTIGPPADIYLLGAMLYETITGQAPHTGADVMQCLYAAARNEIQPTDKSGELLDIAYRAMATQPADRYASVQAFQAAIREYQSHSESVVLSTRADEELASARKSRDYQDFARALFAFQEASSLWSGNERAKAGEIDARLAYAKTALEKEDFDLGVSLLDERHPEQARLRRQLVSAQKERSARQARFKGLRRTAQALAATIFVVVSSSLFFILQQYQRINGINAELQGTIIDLKATQNRLALEKQNVENEKQNVERSNTELTKTQERLVGSNVALVAAKKTALSEAQTARQEEQNAAAASYRAQIGVAAERIDNNSFRDAERLLDDYQASQWSYFRHWEWGHLKWLCSREAGEIALGTRVEALARSADGKLLAAGTASGQVLVFAADWPGSQLRLISGIKLGGPVTALDLSTDGEKIAAAGDFDAGAIMLYQRQDARYEPLGKPLAGHPAGVLSVKFSSAGEELVSTARDGAVRLWNIATGRSNRALFGHSGPVWCAAFSPDGQQIVTAGDDATVRLWRVGNSQASDNQPRIYRGHDGPVYAVAFAPAGNWIASAGRDRDVHLWKADKDLRINYDQIARALERERRSTMRSQQPAAADGQPAAERQNAFHTPDIRLTGHTAEIRSLSFSADGRTLLSGGNDNTLRRWSFEHSPRSPDFVTVFRGHGGWIRGCVLGPDDRYAASGSLEGTIKLWDANQYEEVRTLRGHEDAVYWAAFSSDGERIITAGRDRRALLWNRISREPVLVFDEGERDGELTGGLNARLKEGHDFLVTSGLFFPDERHIATSAGDGTVRIWDRNTGGQVHRLAGTGTLGTLALSRDGRWLVTGSDKTDALLWRTDNLAAPAARLAGHAADVASAAVFAPAGGGKVLIATGDVLGGMRLYSFDPAPGTARLQHPLNGHAQGYAITGIAFTADGHRVLSASQDRTVLLHDAATGERQPTVLKHPDSVRAMDVSADGARAITLCSPAKDTYRITLWELAGGASQTCEIVLPRETVTSVNFDSEEQRALLASSGANSSRLWQWDLMSPSPEPLWPGRELRGTVWSAVPSHDGKHVLAVGGSQARLLAADQGELERIFSPHGPVTAAAFSPLGRLVATCSSDGDVKLWSVDPKDENYGRVVLRLVRPHKTAAGAAALNFVAFAPEETADEATLLTAGDDGTAKIWQVRDGAATLKATLTGHRGRVRSALYSPDGKLILTAGDDRTARLWDAASGQPATVAGGLLKHPEIVLFATFSSDGQRLITGCDDNNAYVFDLAAAEADKPLHVLTGHTAAVTSAAISPDGSRAATGSQDGIAKIWDLGSGKEVLSLKRHTAELTAVHFSPDGDSILTSSLDQTALLWPAVPILPSIKLSAPRLVIGRDAGQYPIDAAARLVDPDASDLAGATLRVLLTAENNDVPATIELATGPLRINGNQVLAPRGGTDTPVAELGPATSPAQSPAELATHFLPAATTADGQQLLRQLALRINQPLDAPLTVHLVLTASTGQPLSETQAMIQSSDPTDTPGALAAAQAK